jgi:hypothetical protein
MRLTSRESILAWVTGLIIAAGLTYLFCEPKVKEFLQTRLDQKKVQEKIDLDERLVAQKQSWQARLHEVSNGLLDFPLSKDVTADMLITLERIAKTHGVVLVRREADKEKKHGEMSELAITCKWEGTLDALVHFLFELQEQGAMLDMSQLSVTPEKGLLKGQFVVDCAYRKTAEAGQAGPSEAHSGKGK